MNEFKAYSLWNSNAPASLIQKLLEKHHDSGVHFIACSEKDQELIIWVENRAASLDSIQAKGWS